MTDQTQPLSTKMAASHGIYYRSARYRIKCKGVMDAAIREVVGRHNISARDVPEEEASSKQQPAKDVGQQEDRLPLQRGFSLNSNVRVRRNTPHQESQNPLYRTTKDWSYVQSRTGNYAAPTYMQSVNDMLALHKTAVQADSAGWNDRSRVQLPFLEDLQHLESQFTVLDPIRIQISYVQTSIDETALSLKGCEQHLKQTAATMKLIQPKIVAQLDEIKNTGLTKLSILRNMLHRDTVRHNEAQMRMKQQLVGLQAGVASYKQSFDATLSHIQNLQEVVFRTMPFELVQDPTEGPPFQEKLF